MPEPPSAGMDSPRRLAADDGTRDNLRRQRAGCARRHCETEPWIPRAKRSGAGADQVIGAEWLRLIGGMKSVGAAGRFPRRLAPLNGLDN